MACPCWLPIPHRQPHLLARDRGHNGVSRAGSLLIAFNGSATSISSSQTDAPTRIFPQQPRDLPKELVKRIGSARRLQVEARRERRLIQRLYIPPRPFYPLSQPLFGATDCLRSHRRRQFLGEAAHSLE